MDFSARSNFGVRQHIATATKSGHFGLIDIEDTKLGCFCLRLVARLRYVPWFEVKGLFPQGYSCSGRSAGFNPCLGLITKR